MKTLAATLLISAFAVAPAMASCGYGKMADHKASTVTASATTVEEQAISTFDPAQTPAFETTKKVEETVISEEEVAD